MSTINNKSHPVAKAAEKPGHANACSLHDDLCAIQVLVAKRDAEIRAGRARPLPGAAAFLDDGRVLCRERGRGDSRYPYGTEGFNLWVSASGYLHCNLGLYFLFLPSQPGHDPPVAFFAGHRPAEADTYQPLALLPTPYLPNESSDIVDRFTVIGHDATYYVTRTPVLLTTVRVFLDQTRPAHAHIHFSVLVQNQTGGAQDVYASAYMNPFCRHQFAETNEDRWFKKIRVATDGDVPPCGQPSGSDTATRLAPFIITTNEDVSRFRSVRNHALVRRCASLRCLANGKPVDGLVLAHNARRDAVCDNDRPTSTSIVAQECTSHLAYVGSPRRGLSSAAFLTRGRFDRPVDLTVFNDNAVVGDLLRTLLPPDTYLRTDYVVSIPENEQVRETELHRPINHARVDETLHRVRATLDQPGDLHMRFCGSRLDDLDAETFNQFLPFLKKQVAVCAGIKGYLHAAPNALIGIRDVFQAIEGRLYDEPVAARGKILEALDYVLLDGRCPRQYSLPVNNTPGQADLREFIDQGAWVISTVYTYVAVTGDASLLGESAGYHRIESADAQTIVPAAERDSVLEHLLRIMDYLSRQRDPDTGLVLALYGDWNDALDGLGTPTDSQARFGTGVSIMTSLQLRKNCDQMTDILARFAPGQFNRQADHYHRLRMQLDDGLRRYAVTRNGNERRIVHGWGDKRRYFVGSYRDSDGLARDGLTSNAYWVLSGMLDDDPSLRRDVLAAFDRLDSPYGLKTFEPGFAPDAPGVGRIGKLPIGTAENGAVYIHATTFAIASLFHMGEPVKAWRQIAKILPFAPHHTDPSHSPFVMPNSYVHNPALNLTGQSMNDWQTGCSNVLLKILIRYVCGFDPTLDHLRIGPAGWIPFDSFEFRGVANRRRVRIVYCRGNVDQREFLINNRRGVRTVTDPAMNITVAIVPFASLDVKTVNQIIVTDPAET